MRTVLVDWLRVSEVWVGANFLFGHDRSGNFPTLRTLGQRYGFRADKIDPVRYKEFVVSSTRVRRLVAEGRMDEAGALLGHQFYIDGVVVTGSAPRPRARLSDGEPGDGATSCCRPTASTRRPIDDRRHRASEHHQHRPASDVRRYDEDDDRGVRARVSDGDLYGRQVRLGFVQRLRDERKFEDVDALRAQIEADRRRAERLFAQLSV